MQIAKPTLRQRILIGDMLLHFVVLGWVLWPQSPRLDHARASVAAVSLFDAPMTSPAATPPALRASRFQATPADPPAPLTPPTLPTPPFLSAAPPSVVQQVVALIGAPAINALAVQQATPAAAPGRADRACDLTGLVQAALRDDPALGAKATQLPVTTLSIANAFMLWDVEWVAPRDEAARSTIDSIRSAISRQIADAPLDCRDQIQVGPRLIFVGPESAAITLVIGSGFWRWADVEERAPQSPVLEANRDSASDG